MQAHATLGVRLAAEAGSAAPAAPVPFVKVKYDDSDGEDDQGHGAATATAAGSDRALDLAPPSPRENEKMALLCTRDNLFETVCCAKGDEKTVREFLDTFEAQVQTLYTGVNEFGNKYPDQAVDIIHPSFKKHVALIKREATQMCGLLSARDKLFSTACPTKGKERKVRKFFDAFETQVKTLYTEVNTFGEASPDQAGVIITPDFKKHVKRVKRETTEKLQALTGGES
jgi:hypothetical protein